MQICFRTVFGEHLWLNTNTGDPRFEALNNVHSQSVTPDAPLAMEDSIMEESHFHRHLRR